MKVSTQGRALIASFEGLRLDAYQCPAGAWTIGYGHTGNVKPGDRITAAEADAILAGDLQSFEHMVSAELAGVETNQSEFDALVSLAFNIGIGGFRQSTVLRLHKADDRAGAARAFSMWNKATVNGKLVELPGLTRRRAEEAALYLKPIMPVLPGTMPQAVAPEKPATASKTVIAGGVSVAAGAASVADQVSQITPTLDAIATAGASMQSIMKLGAIGLSVLAVVAGIFMLVRYIMKKRSGDVVST